MPRPVGRLRETGTPGEARGAGLGGSDGLKGSGAARQPSTETLPKPQRVPSAVSANRTQYAAPIGSTASLKS